MDAKERIPRRNEIANLWHHLDDTIVACAKFYQSLQIKGKHHATGRAFYGALGLPIERDRYIVLDRSLREYADRADKAGYIQSH